MLLNCIEHQWLDERCWKRIQSAVSLPGSTLPAGGSGIPDMKRHIVTKSLASCGALHGCPAFGSGGSLRLFDACLECLWKFHGLRHAGANLAPIVRVRAAEELKRIYASELLDEQARGILGPAMGVGVKDDILPGLGFYIVVYESLSDSEFRLQRDIADLVGLPSAPPGPWALNAVMQRIRDTGIPKPLGTASWPSYPDEWLRLGKRLRKVYPNFS